MSNEIRPEDIRRIAAAKEREVLGEEGIRRFADPTLDMARAGGVPRAPYGTQGHAMPPVSPRPPAARGPYDRNPRAAFDRTSPAAPPPPVYPTQPNPVYERSAPMAPATDDRVEAAEEDLGMPPAYSGAAYGQDEGYYDEAPRRRRRALPMAVAAVALVGFGALVWYAYDWGTSGSVTGEAPVIKAAAGPDKVKPADEGGIQVPNQEATVLNPGAAKPTTEVLMPPPEEPVAPPPPPAPPAPATVTSTQPAVEPPPVVIAPAPAPAAAAAPPSPPPAVATTTSVAATAPAVSGGATIAAGDFLIQLASLTSPEAAQKAWGKMQKAHPSLLGDMTVSIQEADITGKGKYYRVQAGPLPNRATADDMCAQLKAAKQDCIVVKR